MSYIKHTWKTGETIVEGALNNIEEGITEAKKEASAAQTSANTAQTTAQTAQTAANNAQTAINTHAEDKTAHSDIRESVTNLSNRTAPVNKGGTGATTPKGAEYNISGSIGESTAAIVDDTALVMKYGTPSASNGVFRHFKASLLWTWIASKIRSVFGFSSSNVLPVANGGTGNTTGKAAAAGAADKLTTARTIRTNLASTSTASFDGSDNVSPGVTGVLPIANGGTGKATAADARAALGVTPANIGAAPASHQHPNVQNANSAYSGHVLGSFDDQEKLVGWRVSGQYSPADSTTVALSLRVDKDTGTIAARTDSKAGAKYPTIYTSMTPPPITECTGTLPITQGGTGAKSAAAARTNLGLGRVTLWTGTGSDGSTITFTESLNNFSMLAVEISNSPSNVIGWGSGETNAMFMRSGYVNGDQSIFTVQLVVSSDGKSATVTKPVYVIHKSGTTNSAASACTITAVYGWR